MELERSGFTDETGFSQRKGDVIEDYDPRQSPGDWTHTSKFLKPENIMNKKSNTLEKDLKAAKEKISKLENDLKDAQDAAGVATTAGTDDELKKTREELEAVKAELNTRIKDSKDKDNEINRLKEELDKKEDGLKEALRLRKALKEAETLSKEKEELEQLLKEQLESQLRSKETKTKKTEETKTKKTEETKPLPPNPGQIEQANTPSAPPALTPTQIYKRALLMSNTKNIKNAENIGQALNFYFGRNNLAENKLQNYLVGAQQEIGDQNLPEEDQLIEPKDDDFTLVELVSLLLFSNIFKTDKYNMADLIVNFQTYDNETRNGINEKMNDTSSSDVAISWAKTIFKSDFGPDLVIQNMLKEFDKFNDDNTKFRFEIGKKYSKTDSFINEYASRVRNIYNKFPKTPSMKTVQKLADKDEIVAWSKENMISKTALGEKATENAYKRTNFNLASNVLSFPGFGNSMDVGEEEKEEEEEEKEDDDDIPLNVNALAWF